MNSTSSSIPAIRGHFKGSFPGVTIVEEHRFFVLRGVVGALNIGIDDANVVEDDNTTVAVEIGIRGNFVEVCLSVVAIFASSLVNFILSQSILVIVLLRLRCRFAICVLTSSN